MAGMGNNIIHRKVERPITDRELFIEEMERQCADIDVSSDWSFACIAAELFDSGKFKLLEQEGG